MSNVIRDWWSSLYKGTLKDDPRVIFLVGVHFGACFMASACFVALFIAIAQVKR